MRDFALRPSPRAEAAHRLALCSHDGGLPERPMGADCKSVAKATQVRILDPPRKAPASVGAFHLCCTGTRRSAPASR